MQEKQKNTKNLRQRERERERERENLFVVRETMHRMKEITTNL